MFRDAGYDPIMHKRLCRRGFLKAGGIALSACLLPKGLHAFSFRPAKPERSLAFYNLHTGEDLHAVYWCKGEYQTEVLQQINYILRDFRTNEIYTIDTSLLDLLHSLKCECDAREPWHVISGYRSATTNTMLRERSSQIARHSLHMEGKAIDIRLPGLHLSALHKLAVALRGGGVGYYPSSDFIHVDIGRVRYW